MANNVNFNILTNAKQVVQELRSMNAYLRNIQMNTNKMNAQAIAGNRAQGNSLKGLALRFVGYQLILNQVMSAQRKLYDYVVEGVQKFREFETRVAEVSTIMSGDFQNVLTSMEAGIVGLSLAYGKGTSDLSKGLYDIMSAAFEAKDAMVLLNQATKASIAGLSDVRTSVDIFTTILNSYGMSAYESTKVSDTLFQSVVRGKFQFEQLEQALGYVVPIAAQAGIQFEELMAALSTTTRHGLHLDMASRGLALAIQNIINPSDGAAKAAKKYGVEMSGLALRIKGLTGVFKDIKTATEDYGKVVLNELIPNMRSLRVAMVLAGEEGFDGMLDDIDRLSIAAGRTEEALNKIQNTSQFASNQIQQHWEKTQREVGAAWDKMALGLQSSITKVVGALTDPQMLIPFWNVYHAFDRAFSEQNKAKQDISEMMATFTGFRPTTLKEQEKYGGAQWIKVGDQLDTNNNKLKSFLALQEKINDLSLDYANAAAKGSGNLEDIEASLQRHIALSATLQEDFNGIFGEQILGGIRNLENTKLLLEEIGFDIERLKDELMKPIQYGWGDTEPIMGTLNYQMAVLKSDQELADAKYDIKMSLEDENYAYKSLNAEMQEAVRIVREHEEATKKDQVATDLMSIAMRKLQIEMLELQLVGMSRRRGLTRAEEKRMKKIQIEQAKLRLQNMKETKEQTEVQYDAYNKAKQMIDDYLRAKEHENYMLEYDYDQQVKDLQDTIDFEAGLLDSRLESWRDTNSLIVEDAENLIESLKAIMSDPELVEMMTGQGWNIQEMLETAQDAVKGKAVDKAANILGQFGGGKIGHPALDILDRMRGFQRGISYVHETGPAILHRGETVLASGQGGSGDIIIENLTISVKELAEIGSVEKLGALLSSAKNSQVLSKNGKSRYRLR